MKIKYKMSSNPEPDAAAAVSVVYLWRRSWRWTETCWASWRTGLCTDTSPSRTAPCAPGCEGRPCCPWASSWTGHWDTVHKNMQVVFIKTCMNKQTKTSCSILQSVSSQNLFPPMWICVCCAAEAEAEFKPTWRGCWSHLWLRAGTELQFYHDRASLRWGTGLGRLRPGQEDIQQIKIECYKKVRRYLIINS